MRETGKRKRKPYDRTFRNQRLWTALDTWRRVFRPLYDGGDWLFPSKLDLTRSISESHPGEICRTETLARLGVAVSIHDIRGNVATEASEHLKGGAESAPVILGHADPRTTLDHYDHSEDLGAARAYGLFIESRQDAGPALVLGLDEEDADDDDDVESAPRKGGKSVFKQQVEQFRSSPLPHGSAAFAAGG